VSQSESEYDIKWRRDSNKPTPEDELDAGSRREALQEIFEEIGVEDEVELKPIGKLLGGDLPYTTIANIASDSIPALILLIKYIEERGDEVEISDQIKEQIDEHHEELEGDE
jgi:hypothetical protein